MRHTKREDAVARITVVNDRPDFLEVMREILEPADHAVTTLNGDELDVAELAATGPDLLIIDLRLDAQRSRLSGWEMVVLARADHRLEGVPIVLCSADRQGTLEHGDELQALTDVHVLLKPFRLGEVEELVSRLLDREATPMAAALEPPMVTEAGGPP
jgi:CheY-like chemotaxis protein